MTRGQPQLRCVHCGRPARRRQCCSRCRRLAKQRVLQNLTHHLTQLRRDLELADPLLHQIRDQVWLAERTRRIEEIARRVTEGV